MLELLLLSSIDIINGVFFFYWDQIADHIISRVFVPGFTFYTWALPSNPSTMRNTKIRYVRTRLYSIKIFFECDICTAG